MPRIRSASIGRDTVDQATVTLSALLRRQHLPEPYDGFRFRFSRLRCDLSEMNEVHLLAERLGGLAITARHPYHVTSDVDDRTIAAIRLPTKRRHNGSRRSDRRPPGTILLPFPGRKLPDPSGAGSPFRPPRAFTHAHTNAAAAEPLRRPETVCPTQIPAPGTGRVGASGCGAPPPRRRVRHHRAGSRCRPTAARSGGRRRRTISLIYSRHSGMK